MQLQQLTIEPGMAWDDIEQQIQQLPLLVLRQEYKTYRGLHAKSVNDFRLEILLENELARRGKP
jgi:hypothetical protein